MVEQTTCHHQPVAVVEAVTAAGRGALRCVVARVVTGARRGALWGHVRCSLRDQRSDVSWLLRCLSLPASAVVAGVFVGDPVLGLGVAGLGAVYSVVGVVVPVALTVVAGAVLWFGGLLSLAGAIAYNAPAAFGGALILGGGIVASGAALGSVVVVSAGAFPAAAWTITGGLE